MAKYLKSGRIHRHYLSLLKKHGKPSGFWKKWCKDKKTKKDREEIVVGAILTQRTNWRNVELALENLRRERILSIQKIEQAAANDLKLLERLIRPAGFYRQKAERLFLFCRYINGVHGSLKNFFSKDLEYCREQLLEQKGVGPETADSILLYGGDKPTFVIDEYTRRFVKKNGLAGDEVCHFASAQCLPSSSASPDEIGESKDKDAVLIVASSRLCRGSAADFSYSQLQELFEKNLPKDFKLYQDYHALIVFEGKNNLR